MRIIRAPSPPVVPPMPPHAIYRPAKPKKRKSSLPSPLTFREFSRGLFNKEG